MYQRWVLYICVLLVAQRSLALRKCTSFIQLPGRRIQAQPHHWQLTLDAFCATRRSESRQHYMCDIVPLLAAIFAKPIRSVWMANKLIDVSELTKKSKAPSQKPRSPRSLVEMLKSCLVQNQMRTWVERLSGSNTPLPLRRMKVSSRSPTSRHTSSPWSRFTSRMPRLDRELPEMRSLTGHPLLVGTK